MAVDQVGTAGSGVTYVRDTSKDNRNSSVDTQTFLKLLVAQLKYQDPLSPQDNTAFVAQLAQMSSMEAMGNMNSTLKNSQAYDMIGKQIYAKILDKSTGNETAYTGTVDSVVIKDGIPYVVVGTTAISVADVIQVMAPPAADETDTSDIQSSQTNDTTDTTNAV
jgi:flagellar basal-body rod modification protein FlgD